MFFKSSPFCEPFFPSRHLTLCNFLLPGLSFSSPLGFLKSSFTQMKLVPPSLFSSKNVCPPRTEPGKPTFETHEKTQTNNNTRHREHTPAINFLILSENIEITKIRSNNYTQDFRHMLLALLSYNGEGRGGTTENIRGLTSMKLFANTLN